MGKMKKQRRVQKMRSDPVGGDSDHQAIVETTYPLVEKLSSPSADDRHCACISLSHIVLDSSLCPALLRSGVVRRLGPLLVDQDRAVREAAAGALRNLSLSDCPGACEEMVAADVMTPVAALFVTAFSELQAAGISSWKSISADESQLRRLASTIEQTLHLLWNLSEASPVAVEVFNKEQLLPHVVRCLQPAVYPRSLLRTAAQCLQTVSEDNATAVALLASQADLLLRLTGLLKEASSGADVSDDLFLRVLVAGTLANVVSGLQVEVHVEVVQLVLATIGQALDADVGTALAQALPTLDLSQASDGAEVKEPEEVQVASELLLAQQLSLEILANLCCTDGDADDEWEDLGEDEDAEVMAGTSVDQVSGPSTSVEMLRLIVAHNLLSKVVSRCQSGAVAQVLSCHQSGQPLLQRLQRVQVRALASLQNMLPSLSIDVLDGPAGLQQLWESLFRLAAQSAGSSEELMEALAGALRSTLQLKKDNSVQCITADQVQVLCQAVGVHASSSAVLVHLLAALGLVGSLLSPEQAQLLAEVGKVLCTTACNSTSTLAISESLDAIFDIFADGGEVADQVAAAIGLLPSLKQLSAALKATLRRGARSLGEDYLALKTAHVNLVRFLKYKGS